MKKIILSTVIASLSLLQGCVQHLSQAQCMTTNWYQVGMGDGAQGQAPRNLQSSIQDCLKFQIIVDPNVYMKGYRQGLKQYCNPTYELGMADGAAGKPLTVILARQGLCMSNQIHFDYSHYQQGRAKGLISFCTYQNGQQIGAGGSVAPDVCPPNLRAQFMSGWQSGQGQYCMNSPNGFVLGKNGQAFPSICTGPQYIAFQAEYQRGQFVAQRIASLQAKIDNLKDSIRNLASQFSLNKTYGDYYTLGANTTPQAQAALNQVNAMVGEKERLKSLLYQAQTTNL